MKRKGFSRLVSLNRIFCFCFLYSFLALLVSLFFESRGALPCRFCESQRALLFAGLAISFSGFFFRKKRVFGVALSAVFLIGSAVSLWHFFIQSGFLQDPCLVPKGVDSMEKFASLIHSKSPCSKSGINLLGLPASFYNFFVCLFAFSLLFRGVLRRKKWGDPLRLEKEGAL